jgi:hypothetical protein
VRDSQTILVDQVAAGIHDCCELLTIDPSSSTRLDETRVYAVSFGGAVGTTLKLKLQRADGSTFEASVTRQLVATTPKLTTRLLPSGQAYIAFDQFTLEITTE